MPHDHGGDEPPVGRTARRLVVVGLAVVFALTLLGLAVLWPRDAPEASQAAVGAYAAPGVTFPRAEVTAVQPACPEQGPVSGSAPSSEPGSTTPRTPAVPAEPSGCGTVTARILGGTAAGQTVTVDVPAEVLAAGLSPGDRVVLLRLPDAAIAQSTAAPGALSPYSYAGIERQTPLWILGVAFAVAVVAVARWRGLAALAGLVVGGVVLLGFVAPALLAGKNAIAVAVVAALLIMYVVLYLTHGLSLRTSTALVGTIAGVLLMAGLGEVAVAATRLTGVSDDDGGTLQALGGSVSLQGLVTCGIVIGGLGALNDVTITQTSAVWELSAAADGLHRRHLFGHAMRIGRDHLASTVYTLVFAYVGGAMPVLLLLTVFARPWADVITSEDVATEVVRTLCSAFGLILAIPLTTAVAVAVAAPHQSGRHRS